MLRSTSFTRNGHGGLPYKEDIEYDIWQRKARVAFYNSYAEAMGFNIHRDDL